MAWGNCQEIVGIVHLVVIVDGDDVEAPALDILHKGLILLPQGVCLGAWLACPDVAGVELRVARLCVQAAAHHRTEFLVYDVEMCVQVHLHLPELMVTDHHNCIMTESICFQHLSNTLIVSPHATANKRYVASRNVVAALQSSLACDAHDGFQSEVLIAEIDDFRLRRPLFAVHVTDDMSTGGRDTLIACEIKVHQRVLYILRLVARVVVRF